MAIVCHAATQTLSDLGAVLAYHITVAKSFAGLDDVVQKLLYRKRVGYRQVYPAR